MDVVKKEIADKTTGEEKQVTTAKTIMTNAVIGLVLTLSAFAITTFIFGALT